ncbi:SixA phosphatase family protein [Portibacter marinus]|uniref:SixA phosphatase family protein n=1 Tax=Portibacter marinus TaxID=2898660 RepID=UPI001F211DD0|nr:histidine phosphatase family protein [Portibacter marinus]
MKKIIFIRHAKSSWNSGASTDFDRPLNDRGRRDAPIMANKLKDIIPEVDGIIKSPSRRTNQTAEFFIDAFGLNEQQVISERALYHSSLSTIMDHVQSLPAEWNTVLLFAHNPGMTYIAEYFGMYDVENVPTCGMTLVESNVKDWAALNNENSKIIAFEYPKKYSR